MARGCHGESESESDEEREEGVIRNRQSKKEGNTHSLINLYSHKKTRQLAKSPNFKL